MIDEELADRCRKLVAPYITGKKSPPKLPVELGSLGNGVTAHLVDGDYVKSPKGLNDPDFVEGANDLELICRRGKSYIPHGQCWIDFWIEAHDWMYNLYHEGLERRGIDQEIAKGRRPTEALYDEVHDRVNKSEMAWRTRDKVGIGIKPSGNGKLNRLGGVARTIKAERARAADFITYPRGVVGSNCGNCQYNQRGTCMNQHLDHQKVNERNCCALWDAPGTLRD